MHTDTMYYAPTAAHKLHVAWPIETEVMCKPHNPLQNHLLAALSAPEYNHLLPYLELVHMPLGEVLHLVNDHVKYVYFPTTAIVSLVYTLADGTTAETAIIGNEGVLGISLLLGGESTTCSAIVQNAGFGYRLKAQLLKNEFDNAGSAFQILLRYFQALMTHVTQTAVCNRHHSVEQQLCRFLLLTLDRLPSNSITMTQELIANMLGVRREGVTEAAGNLQRAGIIKYSRGHIDVIARSKLEKKACECYGVVKLEFDRLLYNTTPCHNHHVSVTN